MRFMAVGALIGVLVLAAAGAGRRRESAPVDLPPLARHAMHAGMANLRLAGGSASVFLFDRHLWPTEVWTPAVRDATETGRWVGVGAGVAIAVLPGPAKGPLPVRVAVVRSPPPLRAGDDHVVDVDLDLRSGELVLVGSGAVRGHVVPVPPGA